MNKEFPEILKEARNLPDLEDKLRKEGITFKKRKQFLRYITDQHLANNRERLEAILNSPGKHELPDQVVEVNGVKYHLHGIAHGQSVWMTPGWHPRKEMKKELNQEVRKYSTPDGWGLPDSFCEQNLSSSFLDDSIFCHDLKDRGPEFGDWKPETEGLKTAVLLPVLIPATIGMVVVVQTLSGASYLYSKILKNTKDPGQADIPLIEQALHSLEGQSKLAEFESVYELPEPFNLEKEYMIEKESKLYKLLRFLTELKVTTTELSLRVTRKLSAIGETSLTKNVHYLCGRGHVSEIAYFLRNPDYSFNEIEEYMRRTK